MKYESILCDLCQHLVHPYCNGKSKKHLNQLGKMTDKWYCNNCNLKIYPNFLLTDKHNHDILINKNQLDFKNEFITHSDCSVYSKT